MRFLIMFGVLLFVPLPVHAAENLNVDVIRDSQKQELRYDEKLHVYANVVSYLATCNRIEDIARDGQYTQEWAKEKLDDIHGANYVHIYPAGEGWVMPIRSKNQSVSEIYVGFNRNFPTIATVSEQGVQLYAKCMGHTAISNFICDMKMTKIVGIRSDQKLCNRMKEEQ